MDFDAVKKGINSGDFILIDVRGTDEVRNDGKIPSSHLIPLPEMDCAFQMEDTSFKVRW